VYVFKFVARLSPKSSLVASHTHLFVVLFVLIVEICLERQLGAAMDALEATGMKECEILKRPHAIHLIDGLAATQASGLVEIWTIHSVNVVVVVVVAFLNFRLCGVFLLFFFFLISLAIYILFNCLPIFLVRHVYRVPLVYSPSSSSSSST